MKGNRRAETWYFSAFAVLFVLLLFLMAWNICAGSVSLPFRETLRFFMGQEVSETVRGIIWKIRLPRTLAAAVLGGALALSGYLLQTFFRNPIAGPFVLGISSGAKLMVAVIMIFSLGNAWRLSSAAMITAAFFGSLLSMGLVLIMSGRVEHIAGLIVSGSMIGYICSAITDILVTFADDADIVNLHNWSRGSFSGISWENVAVICLVAFPASLAVFFLAKPINAYQMGEASAKSMGVDVKRLRIYMVLLSSLLSGCIVAFAGPVSFVGIAVPHLVRQTFRTSRPLILIPACFLGGSVFCLFCDLIARVILAPSEISISTVTAVFGAPIVILIMLQRKRGRE